MNDKIFMNNYLLILKSTVEVYVHGTLESSNQDVRQLLKSGLDSTLSNQALTYDKMVNCGWYNVETVGPLALEQVLNKVQNS